MSRSLFSTSFTALLFCGPALAEPPSVAVDVAPVHALVSRVMEGVGKPDLVIPTGATPHAYNLRPSEAAYLQQADVVFWVGEDLSPWLERAIETLAEGASVISLLESNGTQRLEFREAALFEANEHQDEESHEHDHDDHGAHDPHAWLSPDNASHWLNVIATELATADPENAATYHANAAAGQDEIVALKDDITSLLDPLRGQSFIVFHDAYQYFEVAFDFPAYGAISLSSAADPSPARINQIQTAVRADGIDCVLAEPQFSPALVETIVDGTEVSTAIVDPLGSHIDIGPGFYLQLMSDFTEKLATCLK